MRKVLCIFFVLLFLFSSCGRTTETHILLNDNVSTTYAEAKQNSAPKIILFTFDNLKEIKDAFDMMQPDKFMTYIENEKINQYMTGLWNYENSKDLLEELCSTIVPLLDGDKKNFQEIRFYWERNEAHQLIFFDERSRMTFYIYTPKSDRKENGQYGPNSKAVLVDAIERGLDCAYIYKIDEEHYGLDFCVEDTYMFIRTADIDTIEELKNNFNRLSFVKVGDLLNETYDESTQPEANKVTTYESPETQYKIVSEIVVQESTEAETPKTTTIEVTG